jgi:hypothetical protein
MAAAREPCHHYVTTDHPPLFITPAAAPSSLKSRSHRSASPELPGSAHAHLPHEPGETLPRRRRVSGCMNLLAGRRSATRSARLWSAGCIYGQGDGVFAGQTTFAGDTGVTLRLARAAGSGAALQDRTRHSAVQCTLIRGLENLGGLAAAHEVTAEALTGQPRRPAPWRGLALQGHRARYQVHQRDTRPLADLVH